MRKILILAAAVFAFCGCNDKEENQPFAGIDNHITSFALTAKDGTVYRAALVGDEIVVSIPRNVSLEGATADYELCEQAILYPDPARITDWDNEHRFRVMAYNQTLRDYAYSVKRNDVTAGSVALPTQADVEAFAATGATVIEGNLTIGDFSACDDPVTDLAPLAGLTDVRYNIVVGNSFAGEKLSGLENLRSAGGLVLGTATTPLTTAQDFDVVLPALESLGQLSVNGNTVAKLDLPKLVSTGTVYINAAKLSVFNVPALKECTGDLTILSGTNASTGNKALAALGLSSLEKVTGSLSLQYLSELQLLELPKIASIGGNCTLTYLTQLKVLNMPELVHLGGAFTWNYLTAATTFAMPKVPSLASFSLSDSSSAAMLSSIDLSSLEKVRADFKIDTKFSSDRLELPALETIGGQFCLRYLSLIETLSIPRLTACENIYFYQLNLLPSLDLSGVESLPSCSYLKKLSAPKLTEVTDKWDTSYMQYVDEGDLELPLLRKIGVFKFWGGTYSGAASQMKLTGMADFAGVTEIGSVDIKYWGKMTDFSGLKNALPSLSADKWNVSGNGYNPTWEQITAGEYVKP
ncbi:hypothetical protein [Alistipes sp.]|uniref:hypothetical protein n=1 Tax=Alistipes sp. TaxID=1872444 RepID=UPI0023F36241|nr:hypothetical protein [Alistipes sp.]